MNHAMKMLSPPRPDPRTLIDCEVRKAELEAEIELRRLQEERSLLLGRRGEVEAELRRMGEPEAKLRAHRTLARWWSGLFALASIVAILSAWWSVNWYLSLTWEKGLLALTLFALPLIGWMAFLMYAGERAKAFDLWRISCTLGLLIILCSLGAGMLLGAGRMAGTALEEERRQIEATGQSDDLASRPEASASLGQVSRVKRLLALFTMAAVILLGVAGEVAAGVAFHEYMKRMTVVWTVEPFYREHKDLGDLLAENAHRQEEVRRRPELRAVVLTTEHLRQEAEMARAAVEVRRKQDEAEERRASLPRLVRRVGILFVLALAALLVLAAWAFGDERAPEVVVVLLDLSRSTTDGEFTQNIQAVEGVFRRIGAGRTRVAVLGITERSFGSALLFRATAPAAPGRFGEYLDGWHARLAREWHMVAEGLSPSANGSDLFGAIARAALELGESRGGAKRLIVLSDMRHVGGGFNFERAMGEPRALVEAAARHGLIPKLDGVRVWVLGAHTAGLDGVRWERLKAFWTEYFRRTGAELVAFGPNRRLAE